MRYPNLHANTAVDVGSAMKSLTEQLFLPAKITSHRLLLTENADAGVYGHKMKSHTFTAYIL